MVNAVDLRSAFRKDLRVRVPPPALQTNEPGAKHRAILFVAGEGLESERGHHASTHGARVSRAEKFFRAAANKNVLGLSPPLSNCE